MEHAGRVGVMVFGGTILPRLPPAHSIPQATSKHQEKAKNEWKLNLGQ